jgi:hypothetical protein
MESCNKPILGLMTGDEDEGVTKIDKKPSQFHSYLDYFEAISSRGEGIGGRGSKG